MKASTLIFLLLFFVSIVHSQWLPASVKMKDSSQKQGYVFNPKPDDKKIKYRKSADADVEKINSVEISAITLTGKNGSFRLENIKVETARPVFMLLLISGPVNLYKVTVINGVVGAMDNYAVKRVSEKEGITYNGGKFKKRMAVYFEDDPETVRYIQETPWLKIDLFEIIRKYNARKSTEYASS